MSKAFDYFYDRLGAETEGMDGAEAVEALLDKSQLLCSAVLVQINVDSHADAYTLFASLNNRGVPLSAVDLIKNAPSRQARGRRGRRARLPLRAVARSAAEPRR